MSATLCDGRAAMGSRVRTAHVLRDADLDGVVETERFLDRLNQPFGMALLLGDTFCVRQSR